MTLLAVTADMLPACPAITALASAVTRVFAYFSFHCVLQAGVEPATFRLRAGFSSVEVLEHVTTCVACAFASWRSP
jgi:hypothetical protein